MYRERVNEKLPTEYLLHEFDELISCKSLGSYNCCEMVSIYLCQREKEMPDNVYTIFVFETRPNVEKSSERLLRERCWMYQKFEVFLNCYATVEIRRK